MAEEGGQLEARHLWGAPSLNVHSLARPAWGALKPQPWGWGAGVQLSSGGILGLTRDPSKLSLGLEPRFLELWPGGTE